MNQNMNKFKKTPHKFNGRLGGKAKLPWPYCTGCGLVLLNNESTRKRAQQSCDSMEEK